MRDDVRTYLAEDDEDAADGAHGLPAELPGREGGPKDAAGGHHHQHGVAHLRGPAAAPASRGLRQHRQEQRGDVGAGQVQEHLQRGHYHGVRQVLLQPPQGAATAAPAPEDGFRVRSLRAGSAANTTCSMCMARAREHQVDVDVARVEQI